MESGTPRNRGRLCTIRQFHARHPQHRVTGLKPEAPHVITGQMTSFQAAVEVVALRSAALLPDAPSSFMRHRLDRYGVTNPVHLTSRRSYLCEAFEVDALLPTPWSRMYHKSRRPDSLGAQQSFVQDISELLTEVQIQHSNNRNLLGKQPILQSSGRVSAVRLAGTVANCRPRACCCFGL